VTVPAPATQQIHGGHHRLRDLPSELIRGPQGWTAHATTPAAAHCLRGLEAESYLRLTDAACAAARLLTGHRPS
jgi:hypothetical protein